MDDKTKSNAQLIDELNRLRQEVAQLGEQRRQLEIALQQWQMRYQTVVQGQQEPVDDLTGRNETKETLWERVHRLKAFIKNSSELIIILDRDYRFWYLGPATIKTLGYLPEELVGQPVAEWMHPDDMSRLYKTFEQAQQQPERTMPAIEYRIRHKNGTWHSFATTITNLFDTAAINGFLLNGHDITRQKRAEQALRESEERYRRLVELSPDCIVVYATVDGEEQIVFVNPAGAKIFGANSPKELIGKPSFDFVHPDYVELVVRRGEKILNQGQQAPEIEQKLVQLNGNIIDVETVSLGTTYQNKPAIQSVIRDITERKRAEIALRNAEARYRMLVEQLPAITYTVEFDEQGSQTTYISPQVESLLGFSQQEWMADRTLWIKQLHPEDRNEVLAAVERSNTHNEPLDMEYRVLARNRRVFWFRNRQTRLIQDKSGSLQYIHGVMLDITEQKQLENQLRQAQKMEAVGQLAGGIAHNFNNMLTALIGHTELALGQVVPESAVHEDLKSVKKSAQRAAQLIQQLLAFTRHQVVYPKLIDLNDLVRNMVTMLRQLITEAIDLEILTAPNLGNVKADPNQIEQVLINLVVNARDAMPLGGRLTIQTANVTVDNANFDQHIELPPGQYILLAVKDTGLGMTEEIIAHIFEPFFSTKEVGQGTGLGLSTCFGIVRQNKGYILVESEPNKGSTFKIYLPSFLGQITKSSNVKAKDKQLPGGSETILVVEDAVLVKEMTVRVLRQHGYQVLAASDGEDALQTIQTASISTLHLLITDLVMPYMGGDALAKQLVQQYPDLKVIFISGYSDRVIARRQIGQKVLPVLTKPFAPDALIRKVRSVLDDQDNKATEPQ